MKTIVRGRRIPCPPGHDCEYVKARTALVAEQKIFSVISQATNGTILRERRDGGPIANHSGA